MKQPVAGAKEITSKKCGIPVKGPESLKCGISADVARKFRVWFERNLAGFRSGLIGGVEYWRAGALDDRPGDDYWYANAYDRAVLDYTESATPAEEDFIRSHPLIVLQLLLGLTDMRGIRCMRRGLTQRINSLQQKSYRSRYYDKDNRRRRILAAARRKINKRTTLNPCPTPDEFRAAFAARNGSVEARIRFGGMVHDLECYVDNCLRINDAGEIVGRNGGIKHWLADNVPELYERYKTIMRYKALVRRIRQAVQVCDPVPTSDLLADAVVTGEVVEKVAGETPLVKMPEGTPQMGVMPEREMRTNYYAIYSRDSQRKEAGGMRKDETLTDVKRADEMRETAKRADETQETAKRVSSQLHVVSVKGVARVMTSEEWRNYYYALESHMRRRRIAAGRVKDIFEGCANTMAGVFRSVDDYLDKNFDEFGCFVVKKVETSGTVGGPAAADGNENVETEVSGTGREQVLSENGGKSGVKPADGIMGVSWGRKSDAYVRADGKRLPTRADGKRLSTRGDGKRRPHRG